MGLNRCDLMIKLKQMRSCFLRTSKEIGFLRWSLLLVKLTTKDLEYHMSSGDKAETGSERTDSSPERSPAVGETLSKSTTSYRELLCERDAVTATNFISVLFFFSSVSSFKELSQPPPVSVATPLISQRPSISRQDPPPAKIMIH